MENENINQQEKRLFLSILQELEQIPKEYLKAIFDWEKLSDEIMERRKKDNQQFFNRMNNFINE